MISTIRYFTAYSLVPVRSVTYIQQEDPVLDIAAVLKIDFKGKSV